MKASATVRRTAAILGWLLATAAHCVAQSFNIDVDVEFGPPILGTGAPTSAFGGAANQVGYWDKVGATMWSNGLRGLDGSLTSVRMAGPQSGSGSGHNIPINTGDFALLLNDARKVGPVGDALKFRIHGLQNGFYRLMTYAVSLQLDYRPTQIEVLEATNGATKISAGPMPGNQFSEGVTHTVHEVNVTNHEINITAVCLASSTNSYLNGMQLTMVPEPGIGQTLMVCSAMLIWTERRFGRVAGFTIQRYPSGAATSTKRLTAER